MAEICCPYYNGRNILKIAYCYRGVNKRRKDFDYSDYVKEAAKINIAKDLYKFCSLVGLNYNETRKVFSNWITKSKYNYDVDSLIFELEYELEESK